MLMESNYHKINMYLWLNIASTLKLAYLYENILYRLLAECQFPSSLYGEKRKTFPLDVIILSTLCH